MENGLNYKYKLIGLIFWTFLFAGASAQPNMAFYPLDQQFNSFDYNPAFLTSPKKYTFTMFPLGGSSLAYSNQMIVENIASRFLQGDIKNQDFKDNAAIMVNNTSFHENGEMAWLSFTYRSDLGFFNFRIKDSEYFLAEVVGDVSKFIFKSDSRTVTLGIPQYLPAQAAHYREYSIGYSYKSRLNKFSAGIRAKVYFGKSAFFSNIQGTMQKVMDTSDSYAFKTSGIVNVSFPESSFTNSNNSGGGIPDNNLKKIKQYVFNTGNPGLGVDLGLRYNLTPELILSLSIIDLGKIKWKSNLNSRNADTLYLLNDAATFKIDTINGLPSITKIDNYTFSKDFDFSRLKRVGTAFSKPLPVSIYAGVKYKLNPTLSLSINNRFIVVKDLWYNNISFAASLEVNKILSISSGYSIIGDSYLNFPLAFLFQKNFGQFFIGSDNLASILLFSKQDYAAISFGACFYLFANRNMYLKSSPLTPFYKPRRVVKKHK